MANPKTLLLLASALPTSLAWGVLGHETVALVATEFVSPQTRTFFQSVLGSNSTTEYLADVAAWADSWKKTDEGAFSYTYHFIDALDEPPKSCNVDLERDCGPTGCVVSALANYTTQLVQGDIDDYNKEIAAKLVIHFAGDIGQPLHCDNIAVGGNEINVVYGGKETNLHAVWDTSIPESITSGSTRADAHRWADELIRDLKKGGAYHCKTGRWVRDLSVEGIEDVVLGWARESNQDVCDVVMPHGVEVLEEGDLSGAYTDGAVDTVRLQVAKQGYRLAKLLDAITEAQ